MTVQRKKLQWTLHKSVEARRASRKEFDLTINTSRFNKRKFIDGELYYLRVGTLTTSKKFNALAVVNRGGRTMRISIDDLDDVFKNLPFGSSVEFATVKLIGPLELG